MGEVGAGPLAELAAELEAPERAVRMIKRQAQRVEASHSRDHYQDQKRLIE